MCFSWYWFFLLFACGCALDEERVPNDENKLVTEKSKIVILVIQCSDYSILRHATTLCSVVVVDRANQDISAVCCRINSVDL